MLKLATSFMLLTTSLHCEVRSFLTEVIKLTFGDKSKSFNGFEVFSSYLRLKFVYTIRDVIYSSCFIGDISFLAKLSYKESFL
jgi:hypothetical protein